MSRSRLKFGFQLPKNMVLELTGKHSSCSEHISLQAIGIWLRMHISEQTLMHQQLPSTIIFPKMLHLHGEMYLDLVLLKDNTWPGGGSGAHLGL